MLAEERRSRVLEMVRSKGFAALPDLANELRVSESTIRRDLDHLEELGEARRTHGGVFYTGGSPQLPHFEEREPAHWDKKRAIAAAAVSRRGASPSASKRAPIAVPIKMLISRAGATWSSYRSTIG